MADGPRRCARQGKNTTQRRRRRRRLWMKANVRARPGRGMINGMGNEGTRERERLGEIHACFLRSWLGINELAWPPLEYTPRNALLYLSSFVPSFHINLAGGSVPPSPAFHSRRHSVPGSRVPVSLRVIASLMLSKVTSNAAAVKRRVRTSRSSRSFDHASPAARKYLNSVRAAFALVRSPSPVGVPRPRHAGRVVDKSSCAGGHAPCHRFGF